MLPKHMFADIRKSHTPTRRKIVFFFQKKADFAFDSQQEPFGLNVCTTDSIHHLNQNLFFFWEENLLFLLSPPTRVNGTTNSIVHPFLQNALKSFRTESHYRSICILCKDGAHGRDSRI